MGLYEDGWRYRFSLAIDEDLIVESDTNVIAAINIRTSLTDIGDGGFASTGWFDGLVQGILSAKSSHKDFSDIRWSADADGEILLPFETISVFDDKNITPTFGWYVKMFSVVASIPNIIYGWLGNPSATKPLPTDPNGSEAVWDDYAFVALTREGELQQDATGNGGLYTSSEVFQIVHDTSELTEFPELNNILTHSLVAVDPSNPLQLNTDLSGLISGGSTLIFKLRGENGESYTSGDNLIDDFNISNSNNFNLDLDTTQLSCTVDSANVVIGDTVGYHLIDINETTEVLSVMSYGSQEQLINFGAFTLPKTYNLDDLIFQTTSSTVLVGEIRISKSPLPLGRIGTEAQIAAATIYNGLYPIDMVDLDGIKTPEYNDCLHHFKYQNRFVDTVTGCMLYDSAAYVRMVFDGDGPFEGEIIYQNYNFAILYTDSSPEDFFPNPYDPKVFDLEVGTYVISSLAGERTVKGIQYIPNTGSTIQGTGFGAMYCNRSASVFKTFEVTTPGELLVYPFGDPIYFLMKINDNIRLLDEHEAYIKKYYFQNTPCYVNAYYDVFNTSEIFRNFDWSVFGLAYQRIAILAWIKGAGSLTISGETSVGYERITTNDRVTIDYSTDPVQITGYDTTFYNTINTGDLIRVHFIYEHRGYDVGYGLNYFVSFYVIKEADHLKMAESYEDAIAGTAITIGATGASTVKCYLSKEISLTPREIVVTEENSPVQIVLNGDQEDGNLVKFSHLTTSDVDFVQIESNPIALWTGLGVVTYKASPPIVCNDPYFFRLSSFTNLTVEPALALQNEGSAAFIIRLPYSSQQMIDATLVEHPFNVGGQPVQLVTFISAIGNMIIYLGVSIDYSSGIPVPITAAAIVPDSENPATAAYTLISSWEANDRILIKTRWDSVASTVGIKTGESSWSDTSGFTGIPGFIGEPFPAIVFDCPNQITQLPTEKEEMVFFTTYEGVNQVPDILPPAPQEPVVVNTSPLNTEELPPITTDIPLTATITDPNSGEILDVYFYDASDDSLIGIDSNVTNGGTATVLWEGLEMGNTYSWYAVGFDGGEYGDPSETWTFTIIVDIGSKMLIPLYR